MNAYYQELIKPAWAPPTWVFGPIWTVLYCIIAMSFGYVGWLFWKGKISFKVLLPFILNLAFNLAFTPIQFRLQSNLLSTIDILLVLGTLIWFMKAISPHAKWVAIVNIPYLVWVLIATTLQISITILNPLS